MRANVTVTEQPRPTDTIAVQEISHFEQSSQSHLLLNEETWVVSRSNAKMLSIHQPF